MSKTEGEQRASDYADDRLEFGLISLEQLWEMLHDAYLAGWHSRERNAWVTTWQQYYDLNLKGER